MYKLLLHPTEKKSPPLLHIYLNEHKKIAKEFGDEKQEIHWSTNLENPDLLVQKDYQNDTLEIIEWYDQCAFEFKFGQDCVSSLDSKLLRDELTRMKAKYHHTSSKDYCPMPLYLVIVNEYDKKEEEQVISPIYLARAVTIAQDLNVRVIYCNTPDTFAKNVFRCIRKPPKEIDLGQRFVKKSTGSEWNRKLQVSLPKHTADKIEAIWSYDLSFYIDLYNYEMDSVNPGYIGDIDDHIFIKTLAPCFITDSGRFMQANMEKFLRKVSGQ